MTIRSLCCGGFDPKRSLARCKSPAAEKARSKRARDGGGNPLTSPPAGGGRRAVAEIDGRAAAAQPTGRIGLPEIFAAFFRLGLTSFGGGTVAWLYRDIIERRRWLDDRAFLAGIALGQIMPGSNGVNVTVLVGQQLRRGLGALAAALGLLSGPLVIVLALAAGYARVAGDATLHAFLDGVGAAAVGMMLATGVKLGWRGATGAGAIAVTAATVLAVGVLRWPMLPVILALAPASVGLAWFEAKRPGGRHA
jgi:chromate transporter